MDFHHWIRKTIYVNEGFRNIFIFSKLNILWKSILYFCFFFNISAIRYYYQIHSLWSKEHLLLFKHETKYQIPKFYVLRDSLYQLNERFAQNTYQHAFPIWTPACPICTEITSRILYLGSRVWVPVLYIIYSVFQ